MMLPPSVTKITLPEVLSRVSDHLKTVKRIFQHEDPKGPEAGGLLVGLQQMEATKDDSFVAFKDCLQKLCWASA